MEFLGSNFGEQDIGSDFLIYRFILQLLCHLGGTTEPDIPGKM